MKSQVDFLGSQGETALEPALQHRPRPADREACDTEEVKEGRN